MASHENNAIQESMKSSSKNKLDVTGQTFKTETSVASLTKENGELDDRDIKMKKMIDCKVNVTIPENTSNMQRRDSDTQSKDTSASKSLTTDKNNKKETHDAASLSVQNANEKNDSNEHGEDSSTKAESVLKRKRIRLGCNVTFRIYNVPFVF